jgi:hypothetical protein
MLNPQNSLLPSMKLGLKSFRVGSFAIACLFATTAQAVVVTVNSTQYDVTSLFGNPGSALTTLQTQPWWGNSSTATSFAAAVTGQLGFPNSSLTLGPLFAYGISGIGDLQYIVYTSGGSIAAGIMLQSNPFPSTFAVAQPVTGNVSDTGSSFALLGLALAGVAAVRRRLL